MELAKKYSFQQNVYIKDIDFSDEFINKVKKVKLKKVSNGSEINETSFYNKTIDSSIVSESEKILLEIVKQYKEDFKFKKFNIKSLWVQKYKKNNCHGVHIHGSNEKTFSFIFYIQCTENSSNTVFHNIGYPYVDLHTRMNIKPKEGRCLFFLSSIPHEVLPNNDSKRLILSGNVEFESIINNN